MTTDGAAGDREEREVAGELGGFALARSEVDRASARREDPDWIAAAWADSRSRVLVLDEGQALVRFGDGAAELVLVPPVQAPEGLKFLLGVDTGGTAYFGLAGPAGGLGAGPMPSPVPTWHRPDPGCARPPCGRSGRCSATVTPGCSPTRWRWPTGMPGTPTARGAAR